MCIFAIRNPRGNYSRNKWSCYFIFQSFSAGVTALIASMTQLEGELNNQADRVVSQVCGFCPLNEFYSFNIQM